MTALGSFSLRIFIMINNSIDNSLNCHLEKHRQNLNRMIPQKTIKEAAQRDKYGPHKLGRNALLDISCDFNQLSPTEQVHDLEELWEACDFSPKQDEIHATSQMDSTEEKEEDTILISGQNVENLEDLWNGIVPGEKESKGYDFVGQDPCDERRNLVSGVDFAIHDIKDYCLAPYPPGSYGFFLLEIKDQLFKLIDMHTREALLQCNRSTIEIANCIEQSPPSVSSIRFIVGRTNQCIAHATFSKVESGVIFDLKKYDPYSHILLDTISFIQVTEAHMGKNCFCKSAFNGNGLNLKMKVALENGHLTANMGDFGVLSSPCNCRMEDASGGCGLLLGSLSEERYLVKVGARMSPLLAMAISVSRISFIDSFLV